VEKPGESAKNHPGLLRSPTEIEAVPVVMKELNRSQQAVALTGLSLGRPKS
jgi:hypothetical protein